MNQAIQEILDRCAQVDAALTRDAATIAKQQEEILALHLHGPTLIFPALQSVPWEMLWGLGRSVPVTTTDHGTAVFTPGEPAVIDFHPKILASLESDNLYLFRRIGPYIAAANATKVAYGMEISISDLSACQAFEFECQRQIGTSIWNMGIQLLPGNPWTVRGYNKSIETWVPTQVTLDPALLSAGKTLSLLAAFTLSDTGVSHDFLLINGQPNPMALTQPLATAKIEANYFNVAVQPDALQQAKPYQVTMGRVRLHLAS